MLLGLLMVVCVATAVGQSKADAKKDQTSSGPANQGQASTSAPETTVSVKVNVVNVLATVRDKHGQIVGTLGKDDFVLTEDGRPQTIHYFTRETDLPLMLGLLVDTSLSQRRVLDQERSASHSFLDQMVREDKDKAFVIHFDREVELLQDFTSSHEKLEAALRALATPQFTQTSGGSSPNSTLDQGVDRAGILVGGGTLLMTLSTWPPMS